MTIDGKVQVYFNTYRAQLELLNACTGSTPEAVLSHDHLNLWGSVMELRSIRMGVGRQSGKTLWVGDFLRYDPTAVVVSANKDLRDATQRMNSHIPTQQVVTVRDIVSATKSNKVDVIEVLKHAKHFVFDDASYNNKIKCKELAEALSPYVKPDTVVVLLG